MLKKSIAITLIVIFLLCLPLKPKDVNTNAIADSSAVIANNAEIITKLNAFMYDLEKMKYFHGSVLVSEDGRILLNQSYGMADYEKLIKNTPKTRFAIGSVTKQFTAMGILLLQERGLLNINDKLSEYIKDFPRGNEITLYNLLAHSSGLVNYTDLPGVVYDYQNYSKEEDLIDMLKKEDLKFEPGTKFEYCNSGYMILGYIIRKVSELSYGDFMKKYVFEPLKMKDTGVCYIGSKKQYDSNGYKGTDDLTYVDDVPLLRVAYGAGCLYSTTGDLYLWNKAVTGGEFVDEKTLDVIKKDRSQ